MSKVSSIAGQVRASSQVRMGRVVGPVGRVRWWVPASRARFSWRAQEGGRSGRGGREGEVGGAKQARGEGSGRGVRAKGAAVQAPVGDVGEGGRVEPLLMPALQDQQDSVFGKADVAHVARSIGDKDGVGERRNRQD